MKSIEMIFKDDNLGFGDKIGCCPCCDTPVVIPLQILFNKNNNITEIPCKTCGQLIKIK